MKTSNNLESISNLKEERKALEFRIEQINQEIENLEKEIEMETIEKEGGTEKKDIVLQEEVREIVDSLNAPSHFLGYEILIKAVLRFPDSDSLCKDLYDTIAKECNCEKTSVERNLRNIVGVIWKRDKEALKKVLGYKLQIRPRPGEMIALISHKIELRNQPKKKEIYDILNDLGVRADLEGYKLIVYTVLEYSTSIGIKELYRNVSNKYSVTEKTIERNIRTARDSAWKRNQKAFKEILGYGLNRKITVVELICLIHQKIERSDTISKEVRNILNRLNVPPDRKGYSYLADVIRLYCSKCNFNDAYDIVAENYDNDRKNVRSSIDRVIEEAWQNDKEGFKCMLGYKLDKKPSVGEVISILSRKLKDVI